MNVKNAILLKNVRGNAFYFVLGFLAFLYVLIRAIKVGITYDEAWTINSYVHLNVFHLIFCSDCEANNHLLNTLLIKLFFLSGNQALFIARLPNVMAFTVYLIFACKISTKFFRPVQGFGVFALLVLNPFVLDFFSLARGYGLALAFQLASLYFLLDLVKEKKLKSATLSLLFASLSVLSNFAFLNYWLVLLSIVIVLLFVHSTIQNHKKAFLPISIIVILLFILIYQPILGLSHAGGLYYGGNNNFYSDTLISLTKYSLYNQSTEQTISFVLNVFLIALFCSVAVSFFYNRSFFLSKAFPC